MSDANLPIGIEVTHKECGHVLGTFGTTQDAGSVDIFCPKCKRWLTIYNQLLWYPENAGDRELCSVLYDDVSERFNADGSLKE